MKEGCACDDFAFLCLGSATVFLVFLLFRPLSTVLLCVYRSPSLLPRMHFLVDSVTIRAHPPRCRRDCRLPIIGHTLLSCGVVAASPVGSIACRCLIQSFVRSGSLF